MKALNGKLVWSTSFLVAVYFKFIIFLFEQAFSRLSSRFCHQHEGSGGFPDVRRFAAGDGDMGREGSGLHRQSHEGQHQERR